MAKSESFSDEVRQKIVLEELRKFHGLIKGHENLLKAIANL
ncbi:MAG: hypothetical protein QT04_C0058G0014 [archaeon GW2011_AR11]|nr:MAG: hypothetical protein QT04_C0058G0014 [archaeon GW2011_AR11]